MSWGAQVLYEDAYVLAVNKPPGISTAPRHRFEVKQHTLDLDVRQSPRPALADDWDAVQANSLVNRIIGYLGM